MNKETLPTMLWMNIYCLLEGRTASQIHRELKSTPAVVYNYIKAFEELGLITREAKNDRRYKTMKYTEEGDKFRNATEHLLTVINGGINERRDVKANQQYGRERTP